MSKATARRRPGASRRPPARRGGVNWIAVGLIGLLLLVGLIILVSRQASAIDGLKSFGAIPSGVHVNTPVTYDQSPPVGGAHYPAWQNCGIYDQPVQSENAVHSMEHGAVWLVYRPDLPADQIAQLRGLAHGRGYTLLSPYPGLDTAVAVSAWGFQLKVDSAGDPRLAQFIDTYRQGPQTPEPGAACIGGLGTPVDN